MNPGLPPGPRLPRWIQTLQWVYRPVTWMESCARRYPSAFRAQIPGGKNAVFLTEPELIEEVFAMDGLTASAGKGNALLRPLVGDHSLLLLDGARHLRERKRMMPPFHGDRMRAYAETMREVAEEGVGRWPRGVPFSLHRELQALTLEVIFRVVLGMGRGEAVELRQSLREFLEFAMRPSLLLFLRQDGSLRAPWLQRAAGPLAPRTRFLELQGKTDQLLYTELARRRASPSTGEDILSLLLSVRDDQGEPMSDIELRDELVTLLVAGHETTATSLGWTLTELAQHPEVLAKVSEELERELNGKALTAADLPRLKYLDAVVSESLRLRPVLPIVARLLERPVRLGPYALPQGTLVCPCIYLVHRRPELYPDPSAFRPERFLGVSPSPNTYFPFGGGARRCIGRAFALFEMKVVLAQLLSQVRLQLAPGYQPRTVRRSITLAPSEGTPMVVATSTRGEDLRQPAA